MPAATLVFLAFRLRGRRLARPRHNVLSPGRARSAVCKTSIRETPQAIERHRRARTVSEETLASGVVASSDVYTRVDVECVVKAKEEPMT